MPMFPRCVLAAVASLPLAAAAADSAPPSAPVSDYEFRLKPGQSHEICRKLERGKGLDFRFNADAPVDFDIRTRAGTRVLKPWDAQQVMHQVGRFVARRSGEHCMTWTAQRDEAGVMGKWQPYAKR